MKTPTTLLLSKPNNKNLAVAAQINQLIIKLKDLGSQVILFDTDNTQQIFSSDYMLTVKPNDVVICSLPDPIKDEETEQSMILAIENEGYLINDVTDFSGAAEEELYIHGTSSIIVDQKEKTAYCMITPKSDEDIFIEFCEEYQMQPLIFHCAKEFEYTTQVLMLGEGFALVAIEAFTDKAEMKDVIEFIKQSGREIIKITRDQAIKFAIESINVTEPCGKSHLLLSDTAYAELTEEQKKIIQNHATLHHIPFDAVETLYHRGLSTICMPVFLEKETE